MHSDLRDDLRLFAADLRVFADRREATLTETALAANDDRRAQRLWLADTLRDYTTLRSRGIELYEQFERWHLADKRLRGRLEQPIPPRTRSPRSALKSIRTLAKDLETLADSIRDRPPWYQRPPWNHKAAWVLVRAIRLVVAHPFATGLVGLAALGLATYSFVYPRQDSFEEAAAQCQAVAKEVATTRARLQRSGSFTVSRPTLVALHPFPTNVNECSKNTLARVMILTPNQASAGPAELRVYDVRRGHLHLAYDFIPESAPSAAAAALSPNPSSQSSPNGFIIRINRIGPLPDGSRHYLLFDLVENTQLALWPRPMLLTWDQQTNRYETQALLSPSTTGLRTMRNVIVTKNATPKQYAAGVIKYVYSNPTVLQNLADHTKYVTYAVEGYIAHDEASTYTSAPDVQDTTALALTVGYIVKAPTYATTRQIEVITWYFDLRHLRRARRTPPFPVDVSVSDQSTPIAELLGRLPLP
jgi:hypothetical protein